VLHRLSRIHGVSVRLHYAPTSACRSRRLSHNTVATPWSASFHIDGPAKRPRGSPSTWHPKRNSE
jgi:hypothetical protein